MPSNQNIIIITGRVQDQPLTLWAGKQSINGRFDYLNGKGIEVAALVFDGMMVYKNSVSDIAGILKGCSSSVNQVLEGCGSEFTVKEVDEAYEFPSSTRPANQPVDINLLLQKGVYPYEYMDSFDRFQETELPPIGKFYSSLSRKITSMPRKFGKFSTIKTFENTTISISKQM